MPTIDLATPPSAPATHGALEALPRRVTLSRPELELLAEKAGGAPLPFEVSEPGEGSALESRLGQTRGAADDRAYRAALAALNDPVGSLSRRGLVVDGVADEGVVGALGLIATPEVAVDLDVAFGQIRGRGWHRQRGDAVATLATTDGLVFELAWFESAQWPGELARVATLPEDVVLEQSAAPELVDLPYELLDAGAEALRTGRADLLGAIAAGHPSTDASATELVAAVVAETRGRLRALVADVAAGGAVVGVVSWVLLSDGWRQLCAHQDPVPEHEDNRRVEVRRVQPDDLAAALGPVLAEVSS
jgi:hypothetical protein